MGALAVKPTKEERLRRLAFVERAMTERGWSTGMARALAKQMGVTYQTIYRYRAEVLEEIRKSIDCVDTATARAEFVDKVRRHQISARDNGAWGALSSMLNVEAKVLGIEAPAKVSLHHSTSKDRALPAALYETIERVWGMSQRGELDDMTAPELWAQFETAMGERMAIDAPEAIDVGGL